jgi:hypothetical protein
MVVTSVAAFPIQAKKQATQTREIYQSDLIFESFDIYRPFFTCLTSRSG